MKKKSPYVFIRVFFLNIIVLLSSGNTFVTAQCSAVRSDSGASSPYSYRTNRCEGFYEAQVAAPSIEVVGFYKGRFDFSCRNDEVITLTSQTNDASEWKVRAVGIPLHYYYRMDAEFGSNGRLRWTANEVLYPERIKSNNIGVYAWKVSNNQHHYSPISLSTQHKGNLNDGKLRLVIRASSSVSEVYWRESGPPWKSILKSYSAGESIVLEIPDTEKKNAYWK